MARIRSIHPGAFTDEAIVSLSPLARWLYVGLWTQAFDDGVFEWKPLTLKMRILPGDNCDAAALLAEIESVGLVRRFDAGGRSYGAIRNFRLWQKPKSPNSSGVLPASLSKFVGLVGPDCGDDPEPDDGDRSSLPNHFGNASEIEIQREEGGGRREEGDSLPSSSSAPESDLSGLVVEFRSLLGVKQPPDDPRDERIVGGVIEGCGAKPCDFRQACVDWSAAAAQPALRSWKQLSGWVATARDQRADRETRARGPTQVRSRGRPPSGLAAAALRVQGRELGDDRDLRREGRGPGFDAAGDDEGSSRGSSRSGGSSGGGGDARPRAAAGGGR